MMKLNNHVMRLNNHGMKLSNYIKVLSAVLIMFGSTTVQSTEEKTEMSEQEAFDYIKEQLNEREINSMKWHKDFNSVFRLQFLALQANYSNWKNELSDISAVKRQRTINKDAVILILYYLNNISKYVSAQYVILSNTDNYVDMAMQNFLKSVNQLRKDLVYVLSRNYEYKKHKLKFSSDDDDNEKGFAMCVNTAISAMLEELNNLKKGVNSKIVAIKNNNDIQPVTKTNKDIEQYEKFYEKIENIVTVLPVLYNVERYCRLNSTSYNL